MTDPFEVMPRSTAAIFNLLRGVPFLGKFVLIGGTGLALHIRHRRSLDLDFITVLPKLSHAELTQTKSVLARNGHTVDLVDDPEATVDFENAGMDLHDYSQNWLIDGEVKVTFFAGDEHHKRILTEPNTSNHFRLGTLDELSRLKALVAASRSKSRDWVDLFILERDHGFGLAQWKETYDKAGLNDSHFETALNRICSGKVSKGDEGFTSLMDNPPSVEEIVSKFRTLRRDYEIALAKSILHAEQGSTARKAYE